MLLTFRDYESSKYKNQKQCEGTQCVCNNWRSTYHSNEPEEGEGHLMYTKESQKLHEEPENDFTDSKSLK